MHFINKCFLLPHVLKARKFCRGLKIHRYWQLENRCQNCVVDSKMVSCANVDNKNITNIYQG